MPGGTIQTSTTMPWSVIRFSPWVVAVLALVQWWLGRQLASGGFGPTPSGVVIGAVLFSVGLCVGVMGAGVVEQVRRRRAVRPAAVAFVFGCLGLALAWGTFQSFLEVA